MPSCESCASVTINGAFCHEADCPDAWKDCPVSCYICGTSFQPAVAWTDVCSDCEAEWDTAVES